MKIYCCNNDEGKGGLRKPGWNRDLHEDLGSTGRGSIFSLLTSIAAGWSSVVNEMTPASRQIVARSPGSPWMTPFTA
jgi:hypothetical protein